MNTVYEKTDCKNIRCQHYQKYGMCRLKGKLPKYFECRRRELAEYSIEAGFKWGYYG